MAQKIMKTSQVAEFLNVTTQTVKNHCKKGLLHPMKINNHYYFTMQDIKNYLDRGKKDGDNSFKKDSTESTK